MDAIGEGEVMANPKSVRRITPDGKSRVTRGMNGHRADSIIILANPTASTEETGL